MASEPNKKKGLHSRRPSFGAMDPSGGEDVSLALLNDSSPRPAPVPRLDHPAAVPGPSPLAGQYARMDDPPAVYDLQSQGPIRDSHGGDMDSEHELGEAGLLRGKPGSELRSTTAVTGPQPGQRTVIPAVIMIRECLDFAFLQELIEQLYGYVGLFGRSIVFALTRKIGLSGGVILLNKYIFTNLNFPYVSRPDMTS